MKRMTLLLLVMLFAGFTTATQAHDFAAEAKSFTAPSTGDISRRFLPTRQRIDREINKFKFAYSGEVMLGLTASYGTLTSEEADIWTLVSNISASGSVTTVKPYVGYFYHDNHCVGLRLGYQHTRGTLKSAGYDLGPSNDASGDLPYLDMSGNSYTFGIFHRSYAGLDAMGRFGVFAEFELSVTGGSSSFADDSFENRTYSDNTRLKLSFNPGVAAYIFPNVCATLSFGMGGIKYNKVTQKDVYGKEIGSRKTSSMRFRLDLTAINIGVTVHLWDRKKE